MLSGVYIIQMCCVCGFVCVASSGSVVYERVLSCIVIFVCHRCVCVCVYVRKSYTVMCLVTM